MELKMIHTIVLFVLLSRVSNVQGQCKRPHFTGNQILRFDTDNFPEGSETRINCATGYVPVSQSSSRYVTCKNSEWTEPELQCKKKTCGNPGEIQHGRYLIPEKDGILFGAVITAECNKGYRLASRSNTRNCQANGWDGRPPICEAVQCKSPDSLPHLTFEPMQDSYQFGEAIKYLCLNGLILIGEKISSCTADGTFQPAPPACRSVSCQRPSIPHAFKIGGKSPPYEYKNFVQYNCDRGYKMNGSNYLICEENGWNPEPPECNIVTCPKLPSIEHGKYEPDKLIYEYEDKITYSCDPCFKLSGQKTKTCSENEYFTPTPATTCTEVICYQPQRFYNGNFWPKNPSYNCGESINFSCNRGYKLIGIKKSNCSQNEKFTIPTCEMWTCLSPQIQNGKVIPGKERYNYGESIKFICNPGYKRNGLTSIKCLENEKFNHPPPTCEVVTCPPPRALINGKFQPMKDNYLYEDKVQFSCNPGYELKGSAESECSQNEKITSPACIKLNCPQPNIKNADTVVLEKTNVNSFSHPVLYRCKEGFKRDGPGYLNCTLNGWNPNPDEQCKEITCEAPDIINGKKLEGPIYKYNSTVEYECDKGYIMNGSKKMTCKQQGWDGLPPQCKIVTCSNPPSIENGYLTPDQDLYNYGDNIEYHCNDGFTLNGTSTILCSLNGTFPFPPKCVEKKQDMKPSKDMDGSEETP